MTKKMRAVYHAVVLPEPFCNVFEVSNTGLVRNKITGNILKGSIHSKGYKQYLLQWQNKRITRKAHVLVATAFIPNPLNKPQINHKDGNKLNNHVDNLEWNTNGENQKHAFKMGLQDNSGENHPSNKLSSQDVINIRAKLDQGATLSSLAKEYNVSKSTISAIKTKRIWGKL